MIHNRINALSELELYGRIGDWWDGLNTAQAFAQLEAKRDPFITVRIRSQGGSVAEAIALHSLLTKSPKEIIVYIDGDTRGAC